MNVFYLHEEPTVAATMLHDKHVVKMILESTQILCAVWWRYGQEAPYKQTHKNHPCVLWAGDSVWHYQWLFTHAVALCNEYTHRYGRVHACRAVLSRLERCPVGMHASGWRQPPQAMPDEFQVSGDPVSAYRKYYLARKVAQSCWTRRAVPAFVSLGDQTMATAKKTAPTSKTAPVAPVKTASAPAPVVEEADVTPRTRGPRGVPETAVINVLVDTNPKREGSKAHAVFSHYESGQTIAEFCAALEATDPEMVKEATPNLVYDAKHGFIEIDGYTPPGGVVVKEVKQPKPKSETAPKGKKAKPAPADTAAADAEALEEVVD